MGGKALAAGLGNQESFDELARGWRRAAHRTQPTGKEDSCKKWL
jgi:hypothetical protein